ncbi:methyl-accepting chemotaxis protein [Opitutus terrae]|uniref:Ig-like domain-containing protein n=1 Tax=Opitutus terrae (strain DSM 11246 / JCM 15787 / PB90-1) TaxID=452637 RepID=B1ZVP4_OPITP|nr:methyl-accepting chemotaxis protein [Opitutus terrae]ACB74141.1 hypothetical protein Oter_0853 [Opitutus terrae PB90-1]
MNSGWRSVLSGIGVRAPRQSRRRCRSWLATGVGLWSLVATAHTQYWSVVPTPVVESAAAYQSADIAAAPGGMLFVSGAPLRRLNTDGSVDAAFNAPADAPLKAVLAYPDGRVLVQSTLSTDLSIRHELLRLTSTGAIDSTFETIALDAGFVQTAHRLSGDRILVSGTFTHLNGVLQPKVCVLNADGTVWAGFQSPFNATPAWLVSALPLPDGKIIVYGDFKDLGPNRLGYLARLAADGSIDDTFTLAGVLLLGSVTDVFQAGERLLVASGSLWALNPDGSRDPTFIPPFGAVSSFGPLQTDGKLLYLVEPTGTSRRELRRLNVDGSADESFVVATEKAPPYAVVRPILGDDGWFYVASALMAPRQAAGIRISRIRSDGTIDESYRPHLTVPADISTFARASDGTLFLAGDFDHVNGQPVAWEMAELRPDGSIDPSFGPELSPYEYAERVWVQPSSGKPIIELFQPGFPGDWFAGVVRLNADGRRDPTFHKLERYASQIAFNSTGRIYAAEATASGFQIIRYSADGVLDATFPAVPATSSIFAVWPDGSMAVTAQRTPGDSPVSALKRYLADGSADTSFSSEARPLPDNLLALVPLPDGRLLAIGATSQSGQFTLSYFRYTAVGAVDFLFYGEPLGANPSPLLPAHGLEVAGVVHDLLRESGAAAQSHHAIELRLESSALKLDVGADGKLVTNVDGFSIYTKTSAGTPTFDAVPEPSIPDGGVLNMGGEMVLYASSGGALPQTLQWHKDGVPIAGATASHFKVTTSAAGAGSYTVTATNAYGSATSAPAGVTYNTTPAAPTVTVVDYDVLPPARVPSPQPPAELVLTTDARSFIATATGNPVPTVHWEHNGRIVPAPVVNYFVPPIEDYDLGPTSRQRDIYIKADPADTGLYTIVATNDHGTVTSSPMLVGLASTRKLVGDATEVGPDTLHPSGRTIDQLLLRGPAAAFTADPGQVTRLSFVDLDHDIVQVELSGAGTVSLVPSIRDANAPRAPEYYVQPGVSYVRCHAGIVVTGADETTNLSVFSVGRANAYNQSLFRSDVTYDGVADIAFVAVLSRSGKFGSLRCANVNFFDARGFTGVYAPGVRFTGPVYLGNIEDFTATPVLLLGGADGETLICGGDLEQPGGRAVRVSGLTRLRFVDGTTSQGTLLPAQRNHARLEQDGVDVTDQIVVNPSP